MTPIQKRFGIALAIALPICLIYPILMYRVAGIEWTIADAASNHYGAIALPLSIAAFSAAFTWEPFRNRVGAFHAVAALFFLALLFVGIQYSIDDAGRSHVTPPHLLKDDEQKRALAIDKAIRDAVPPPRGSYDPSPDPTKPSKWDAIASSGKWDKIQCTTASGSTWTCRTTDKSARACYDQCIPPIKNKDDFLARAGTVGFAGAVHTVFSVTYAAVMLWYLIFLSLALRAIDDANERAAAFSQDRLDLLLLCVLLQLVFFPTRVMTEWYQSYYLFSPMSEYLGFMVLAGVAVGACIFLALMYTGAVVKVLSVTMTAGAVAAGFILIKNPDLLIVLFDAALNPGFYVPFLIVATLVAAALCLWVLRFGAPQNPLPAIQAASPLPAIQPAAPPPSLPSEASAAIPADDTR